MLVETRGNGTMRASFIGRLLGATAISGLMAGAAMAETALLKIGVMSDMSAPYAADVGPGLVLTVKMAVQDAGGSVLGQPIEVIAADDQNKPDVGVGIAGRWIDREDVKAMVVGSISSTALGVLKIAQPKNVTVMFAGSGAAELTGKSCTAISTQWAYDTYSLPKAVVAPLVAEGKNTWYVIGVDYTFGHNLLDDTTKFVQAAGGKMVGSVMHPLTTTDFSSFLLQAQGSGANVVAFAKGGANWTNVVKQAKEFGLTAQGQSIVSLATGSVEVIAAGVDAAQGMLLATPFYADRDDDSRAFSKRFAAAFNGVPPDFQQAAGYSAVNHYLKAVKAAGTIDGAKVTAAMRAMPVDDFEIKNARIREDGQVMRPMYLARVKAPAASRDKYDIYDIIGTIPAETAWRPASEGDCPLVK